MSAIIVSASPRGSALRPWKLVAALFIILFVSFMAPMSLGNYGYIPPLKDHAYYVILIAIVGISIKVIVGDLVSGKFEYHKNGYDMCIMAFGAALSNASIQILSDTDMFPGFSAIPALSGFLHDYGDVSRKRALLLLYLLLTLVATLITAYLSKAASDPHTKAKGVLSIGNFAIGSFVLVTYLVTIVEKA